MLFTFGIDAKVTLPSHFGDGMVLQQKSSVPLHGTATAGAKVTINASWTKKAVVTKADADGAWSATLNTPTYGGPFTITVSDGTPLTLSNVLVGEVWVCAGQSNMEMPMKGFRGQPTHGTADLILSASPRLKIRLLQQKNDWATTEKPEIEPVKWTTATTDAVAEFSAVGYVFGKTIYDALDVPVGLIQCDWSMSTIETWMPRSTFEAKFPEISLPAVDGKDFGWIQGTPTLAWNAMVAPWKGFPVAGVIWFQGEANTANAERYSRLFPAMVADWRAHFGNNDAMPFFYAQLAPWNDGDCRGTRWADFRQMQNELLKSVPGTGMVTIGDLGDSIFIHFPKKIEVGKRFAYLALEKAYGRKGIKSQAPIAKCCTPDSPTSVIIEFEGGEDGLTPENAVLSGFELVDAFGDVHEAKAQILNSDKKVRVWTDWLQYPTEVRYGYHNYYESSLLNNAGLPAAPFRMEVPKQKKTALMWFDAEANYRRFNNPDSIEYYVKKVADLGFTHAVVDVRPITGEVLYNSAIAPKVKDVTNEFDYLARFIEVGHKYGMKVLASMNVFCAGHNYHDTGLIYSGHPEWASVVYDPKRGLIPITEQKHKYGGMVNPINAEYQAYIIEVMKELAKNYHDLDGLMLDRVRYDGIEADFSQLSRTEFEKFIGKKVKNFPGDILSWKKGDKRPVPVHGPLFKQWTEWRTKNITEFMARARKEVKAVRENIIFGTYTGAWYPSYYEVGVNFASKDYDPAQDFDWATPDYKNYGYAELIDLYATGNYYTDITLKDYNGSEIWNETDSQAQSGTWYCVEGSCRHLRQILGKNPFVGGILVDQFYDHPEKLSLTIAENLKDSDGLMVFDIVHIITKNLWKEIEQGMRLGGNLK